MHTENKYEFQDQDDLDDDVTYSAYTKIFIDFLRVTYPIAFFFARVSIISLFWSHFFQQDFGKTFMIVVGCFYFNRAGFAAMVIWVKASVPAYIISKWLDLNFQIMLGVVLCGWKINLSLGMTLFSVYAGNRIVMRTKNGRKVGYSGDTQVTDAEIRPSQSRDLSQGHHADGCDDASSEHELSSDLHTPKGTFGEGVEESSVKESTVDLDAEDDLEDEDKEGVGEGEPAETLVDVQSSSPASNLVRELPRDKPALKAKAEHPGLQDFHNWMGATSDIYRMYQIATRSDEAAIPLIPRSERGHIPLRMMIQNDTGMSIDVFWVDFKGNEQLKGNMGPHVGNVNITTWIGHPWLFREKDSKKLLLHYVPFRIIPNTEETYSHDDTGHHMFAIVEARDEDHLCGIQDFLFPYPPSNIQNVMNAVKFSIKQMRRERVSPRTLLKYLTNIALHPDQSKYRQIRVANKVFWSDVWCNGGRGVLCALGFEEQGPFVEMGPNEGGLIATRVKDLSNAIILLEEYLHDIEHSRRPHIRQPRGADGAGSGRANWRM